MPLLPEYTAKFEQARQYFEQHPNARKWRRKDNGLAHSFIRTADGKIYMMDVKGQYLGRGAFAAAKQALDEDGNLVAVRIEYVREEAPSRETKIAQAVGLIKTRAVRDSASGSPKGSRGKSPDHQKKEYQIQLLGTGLEAYITSKSFLTIQDKKHLMFQLILALTELHEQGIAHLDIKPENIIVDDQGKVHFIDFGFSYQGNPFLKKYPADDFAGTKEYLPYEKDIDTLPFTALDVHALVKTLYLPNMFDCYEGPTSWERYKRFSLFGRQNEEPFLELIETVMRAPKDFLSCEMFLDKILDPVEPMLHDNDENLKWLCLRANLALKVNHPEKTEFTPAEIYQEALAIIQNRHLLPKRYAEGWDEARQKKFLKAYSTLYYLTHQIGDLTVAYLLENLNKLENNNIQVMLEDLCQTENRFLGIKRLFHIAYAERSPSKQAIERFLSVYASLNLSWLYENIGIKRVSELVFELHKHVVADQNEEPFDVNKAIARQLLHLFVESENIFNSNSKRQDVDAVFTKIVTSSQEIKDSVLMLLNERYTMLTPLEQVCCDILQNKIKDEQQLFSKGLCAAIDKVQNEVRKVFLLVNRSSLPAPLQGGTTQRQAEVKLASELMEILKKAEYSVKNANIPPSKLFQVRTQLIEKIQKISCEGSPMYHLLKQVLGIITDVPTVSRNAGDTDTTAPACPGPK